MAALSALEYPVHLALAYLFLSGYLCRTAFLTVNLPGAVGVILSGFIFSYFMQFDILEGRDHLQGLAFFLVLLTAGFEISLADLKPYILIYAVLPSTLEFLGISAFAVYVMDYTKVEGFVLATTLFCIGDGLVIPRMGEFSRQFPGHPMPRFVFMFAPLEASYALTLFGVLQGLAEPARQPSVNISLLVLANIVRIAATLLAGAAVGSAAGWLIPQRRHVVWQGRPVFTNAAVEGYLMILAVALGGFGLGAAEKGGHVVIPMGFSPGSLFQPELLVIVIGCFFAHGTDPAQLHDLEKIVGGVWVFGQLILFSMLGSKTDTGVFSHILQVLPIMAVGIACRFVGMFIATFSTLYIRPCNCPTCLQANRESLLPDALFCFLSTLPRATIQGALGPVPLAQKFFSNDSNRGHVEVFIAVAARLYVVCMSVFGSVVLDAFGPRLLKAAATGRPCCSKVQREEEVTPGLEDKQLLNADKVSLQVSSEECNGKSSALVEEDSPEMMVETALSTLAQVYDVDQSQLLNILDDLRARSCEADAGQATRPPGRLLSPSILATPPSTPLSFRRHASTGDRRSMSSSSSAGSGNAPPLATRMRSSSDLGPRARHKPSHLQKKGLGAKLWSTDFQKLEDVQDVQRARTDSVGSSHRRLELDAVSSRQRVSTASSFHQFEARPLPPTEEEPSDSEEVIASEDLLEAAHGEPDASEAAFESASEWRGAEHVEGPL